MAGFPLAAIGAGLGQGFEAIQKQRESQARLQEIMLYLKQKQQADQASKANWTSLTSGGDDSGGMGGMGGLGGMPGTSPMQAPDFSGGIGGGGASLPRPTMGGGARPNFSSAPGASSGFSSGLQKLTELGLSPEIAAGPIEYMRKNESANNPLAVNPRSGALGRAQWLGSRKAALTAKYGSDPTDEQQAEFMGAELQGPEGRTLAQLRAAKSPQEAYDIWGRSFERPGNAALAKAGVGGGGASRAQGSGAPDPLHQEASQAGAQAMQGIPPLAYGKMTVQTLARQIAKANPGIDPVVGMMALEQQAKLLSPYEQRQWEAFRMMHQDNLERAKEDRARDFSREQQTERERFQLSQTEALGKGRQSVTLPSGATVSGIAGQPDSWTTLTGKKLSPAQLQELEQGSVSKFGAKPTSPLPALPTLPAGAAWEGKPNQPPPPEMTGGLAIDPGIWGAAITYAKSGGSIKPPFSLWGENPTARAFNQALPAAQSALGMKPEQMTSLASAYAAQRAASQTVGRVAGATAQGAEEMSQFRPLIEDVVAKIDPTNFPTINTVFNAVAKGTGDPNIIQLSSYIQSAKNAYVQIMTRAGRPTVYANKRADELLSPNMGIAQIPAALDALENEAAVAQSGAERAVQRVTGQEVTAPRAVKPGKAGAAAPAAPTGVIKLDADGNVIPQKVPGFD